MLLPAQLPLFSRCFNERSARLFNSRAWRVCNRSVADRIGRLDSRAQSFVAHPGLHFFKRAFHVAYVGGAERPVDGDGLRKSVKIHARNLIGAVVLTMLLLPTGCASHKPGDFAPDQIAALDDALKP